MSKVAEVINSNKLVLLDFSAEWCGPCKVLGPILKSVKEENYNDIVILKIDVDRNPQISQQFKIQSVPTLVLYANQKIVWRESGVCSKDTLNKLIQSHK